MTTGSLPVRLASSLMLLPTVGWFTSMLMMFLGIHTAPTRSGVGVVGWK
ncbi:uncharacterized protein METZ01_LOCUS205523 [marine metagenome]|uniref:Uncharacterized protein n=1 Tax=marine metagenome TaxID=408172 RepID=A0A382EQL6_9ZZZZ